MTQKPVDRIEAGDVLVSRLGETYTVAEVDRYGDDVRILGDDGKVRRLLAYRRVCVA